MLFVARPFYIDLEQNLPPPIMLNARYRRTYRMPLTIRASESLAEGREL